MTLRNISGMGDLFDIKNQENELELIVQLLEEGMDQTKKVIDKGQ